MLKFEDEYYFSDEGLELLTTFRKYHPDDLESTYIIQRHVLNNFGFNSKIFKEAKEWLRASFGDGMIGTKWEDRRYLVGIRPRCIFFKNEADFNWFLIRWL